MSADLLKNEKLKQDLDSYLSYHKNQGNRLTHFIGIPLIFFSLFCSLGWFRFAPLDLPISGATLFLLSVFLFYFQVHKGLAGAVMVWCIPLFLIGEEVAVMPFGLSFVVSSLTFAMGWAFQFWGHAIEKNRPAFRTNVSHLGRGPLFITYEWVKLLGFKL